MHSCEYALEQTLPKCSQIVLSRQPTVRAVHRHLLEREFSLFVTHNGDFEQFVVCGESYLHTDIADWLANILVRALCMPWCMSHMLLAVCMFCMPCRLCGFRALHMLHKLRIRCSHALSSIFQFSVCSTVHRAIAPTSSVTRSRSLPSLSSSAQRRYPT